MPWDPDVYHKFQSERAAPFDDLLRLVNVRENLRVVDLGCGTGELTRQLADHLPASEVVGIDNSPEMLERAQAHARPGLCFEQAAIESVSGEWDLVFSHAALQWVDGHDTLVPRLLSLVATGGQIAVQMPSNAGHFTQRLIRDMAAEEPYRTALDGWMRISPVLSIDQYADLLYAHGGRDLTVFEKVYPHVLDGPDDLADWTSGTVLVPYMERLPDELKPPFMQEYRRRLRARWPNGPVFYGFRRTIFAATRA
ncbi:MAG TPA: methyltransferase domain-containing protein [Chloroflexia bacterium]|jgi:trans-aconitate 2-methyltransferase